MKSEAALHALGRAPSGCWRGTDTIDPRWIDRSVVYRPSTPERAVVTPSSLAGSTDTDVVNRNSQIQRIGHET